MPVMPQKPNGRRKGVTKTPLPADPAIPPAAPAGFPGPVSPGSSPERKVYTTVESAGRAAPPVQKIKCAGRREIAGWPASQPSDGQETGTMTGSEDEPSGTGRREPDETTENRDPGFDNAARSREAGRLPTTSRGNSRDFPGLPADFRVDILDHGDRVIVVAELPGVDEETITIRLLNPQTLRITAKRAVPIEEEPGGHFTRERGTGILSRLIRLPASVIAEGAVTGYKNGVLEVRLQKMKGGTGPGGKEIPIE